MEKKPIKNSFQEALYKLFERLKKYLTDNNLSQLQGSRITNLKNAKRIGYKICFSKFRTKPTRKDNCIWKDASVKDPVHNCNRFDCKGCWLTWCIDNCQLWCATPWIRAYS